MNQTNAYYLYDEAKILENLNTIRKTFPGFKIFYSEKTNPNVHILTTLKNQGCGIDAASCGEVKKALSLGFGKEGISYSAPGKTDEELAFALPRCLVVADSIGEALRIDKIAREAGEKYEISVRINPQFSMNDGAGFGGPSQFGIDYEEIDKLLELSQVKICGIHIHVQSQNLAWEVLARYYEHVFKTAREMREKGFDIKTVNCGSGCGIVYDSATQTPLDMERLGEAVASLTAEYSDVAGDAVIEPGRYLVGNAGVFRTRIIDKKVSRGTTYLIASGGMNGFLRPAAANIAKLYGAVNRGAEPLISCEKPCDIRVLNDAAETERVTITGNLCSGFDVFARDIELPKAEVGDMLEFSNAGSYACTLSLRGFANQEKTREFFQTVSGEVIE